MNIFKNAFKDLPKIRPGHFHSFSDVELPWNNELIQYISKEFYVFMDFPILIEELRVRDQPQIPNAYPSLQKDTPNVYLRDASDLNMYNLSSGDLIFFSEVSEIAETIKKISFEEYTRVAMILRVHGITIPFIYDAPPFFLAHYESDKPRYKLLQGRLITLDSFIQTGNFSKIMIRKLTKYGGESFKNPTINRTNISRTKSIFHSPRKHYDQVNEDEKQEMSSSEKIYGHCTFEKEGDEEWMMIKEFFKEFKKEYEFGQHLDISSLFSAKIVALTYKSLGLIDKETGITVKSLREVKKIEKDYLLGPELEMRPLGKRSYKEEVKTQEESTKNHELKIEKSNENSHKTPTPEEIEMIQKQVDFESEMIKNQIDEKMEKKEKSIGNNPPKDQKSNKEIEMIEIPKDKPVELPQENDESLEKKMEDIEKLKKGIEGSIENIKRLSQD